MSAKTLELKISLSRGSFDLDVNAELVFDGVHAVFGPSGSGKTTLLRAIAGLTNPASGTIRFGEHAWFDDDGSVPPHRRPVGLVFQDARLFPHLDAEANLRFGERRRHSKRLSFDEVVAALDLAPLLPRDVETLSGGETRRLALGRALLSEPQLLLLDEPLAGLDAERKAEILPYLERVARQFRLPTIYVSHDIDEVARLANRLLVLEAGRVQALGETAAVVAQQNLPAPGGDASVGVVVHASVAHHDLQWQLTTVDWSGTPLVLPLVDAEAGTELRLRIPARDVVLAAARPDRISIRNVLEGTVAAIDESRRSGFADVSIDLDGKMLAARVTRAAAEDLDLRPEQKIFALVKTVSLER